MKLKRKISIRRILQVSLTVVLTIGCIVVMVSAARIEDEHTLRDVKVHIRNGKKYHFIEEKEITDLAITNRGIDVMHTRLARLDIHTMEQVIRKDPWVADAQVFVDNDRVLHLYVTQRIPVARLFLRDSSSYYIDSTFNTMPLSQTYVYYTTVVTNVPVLKDDSTGKELKKQIVSLVRNIGADSFWTAQVAEVSLDSLNNFELTPVLGQQRIIVGEGVDVKDKLDNLFAFYKNVLNKIGWDKYDVLDLRFRGQVVASPSLPYKGPVDKAINTMNWVNSITETEATLHEKDSIRHAEQAWIKAEKERTSRQAVKAATAAAGGSLRLVDNATRLGLKNKKGTVKQVAAAPVKEKAPAKPPVKAPTKAELVNHAVELKHEMNAAAPAKAKASIAKRAAHKKEKKHILHKTEHNNNKKGHNTAATPKYVYPGTGKH